MIGERGRGLVLILSQPRAGSTLLQRMLGAYPDVHTAQEPAIALYPLRGLQAQRKGDARQTEVAHFFTRSFLQALPDGEEAYVIALRKMLQHLYEQAMAARDAQFFLDKTPRYFTIIPELARVFPEAHYVLLFRNPLAVLGSILATWVRGEWLGVAHARPDLLEAPRSLLAGRERLGDAAITVQYEQVVRTPGATMQRICRHVGLAYDSDLMEYGRSDLPYWPYADQKNVYRYTRPEPTLADKWQEGLRHPQVWRLSRDYLHALGPDIITEMGYDFKELSLIVQTHTPSWPERRLTFSLEWLARRLPAERPWWERRLVWLARRLRAVISNR